MIIHAISDTHNKHAELELPGGTLLVHAGDATSQGTEVEIIKFLNWLEKQPYKHKIYVPGNHDWMAERNTSLTKSECASRDIILLNDSGIDIEGIKIWGSPITPEFNNWAFNRSTQTISPHWDAIPDDTEILITHGPAYGILDYVPSRFLGCQQLLNRILSTQIKLHICGHIHHARGYTYKHDKTWVNAACLNEAYNLVCSAPTVIEKHLDGAYYL